jgi:hypothetical protein
VPVEAGKTPNRPRAGLGFRVWKLRVSKANREKLKTLYNDVVNYLLDVASELKGSKYLTYYADEWEEMYEEVKRMREEAGKRTLPKTPPVLVLVKFIMPERARLSGPPVTDSVEPTRGVNASFAGGPVDGARPQVLPEHHPGVRWGRLARG